MYRKLKEELTSDNLQIIDMLKAGGCVYAPGCEPDNEYGNPVKTVDEFMIEVEKASQETLRKKFGYDLTKKQSKYNYYFITINLPETEDEEKALELYEKMQYALTKYKWLRKSIWNIEFYTASGSHPHSHCLCITERRRDCIIKILSSFFSIEPNFIDIKRFYGDGAGHINYVKGLKKEESKLEYINKDMTLRNKYNIEHYIDNL